MKLFWRHVMRRLERAFLHLCLWGFTTASLIAVTILPAQSAQAAGSVVISQIYGGGGNSGATLRNDFVELFNRSAATVSLNGWCLQYASAAGNFTFSSNQKTDLSGVIAPGHYYLIALAQGTGGSQNLPTPDATGFTAMAAGAAKIALLNSCTTPLDATESVIGGRVVDFVGYGSTASRFEGSGPTSTLSNTSAAFRVDLGCRDMDNNAADFSTAAPAPRNSVSVEATCNGSFALRIRDIQGAGHISPYRGVTVMNVPGVVTAIGNNRFYFQDAVPDSNPATSEAIVVYTVTTPTVQIGDSLLINGTVNEFRPGGSGGSNNLTTTEIAASSITLQSSGNPLPTPIVIGVGGRVPPSQVIDDDATGDVEVSGTFDVATDGIDFYESLEAMRVQINNAVATGPSSSFGELPVIGDNGNNASVRTARGGIVVRANDFNPERIILDDVLVTVPSVNVGATATSVVGVLDYSFGNFKLLPTSAPLFSASSLSAEVTDLPQASQLTVASFNVENLDPSDPPGKFATLALQMVGNLRSPDIVALMEIQDNNGATNNSIVNADLTFQTLINAIVTAGGPSYQYRQINPVNNQDGGEPGGNIRVGFLFNPLRVSFVDRPGGSSTAAVSVVATTEGAQLSLSPGRIAPTNSAFANSRKPLAGEFIFNGHTIFMVANHFNSKGGDEPLFGHLQPPARSSEVQRAAQAGVVANFVQNLVAAQADAKIIVLGDINDFEFSDTVSILKASGLVDLVEMLSADERYTYVFDGNSQVLDHILISDSLASLALPQYDVVHINSEFAVQASDHDPEVVRLTLPASALDVTSRMGIYRSGLIYNRSTQTFNGTIELTNHDNVAISGPIHIRVENLPSGVSLVNANGMSAGFPYVTASASALAPGAKIIVPVRFNNPNRISFAYTTRIFSGAL